MDGSAADSADHRLIILRDYYRLYILAQLIKSIWRTRAIIIIASPLRTRALFALLLYILQTA